MKVWLDDIRHPPPGWTWVKTPAEAIELLQTGDIAELSLDHDLGLTDHTGREQTGYDVLLWIEQQVVTAGFQPPELHVHSANPPATLRMLRVLDAIATRVRRTQRFS